MRISVKSGITVFQLYCEFLSIPIFFNNFYGNKISVHNLQVAVPKGRKTKADSLSGGSPKKKRVCRKKKVEEPGEKELFFLYSFNGFKAFFIGIKIS
jgi:hypothetical protein